MSSSKTHAPPPPLRANIISATFPDEVARHILAFHASTNVRSALPQKDQWTVLASFFTFERSVSEEAEAGDGVVEVLTMATGVKCLGGVQWERNTVLVDMHAEILARRELELLMMEEMEELTEEYNSISRSPNHSTQADHYRLMQIQSPRDPDKANAAPIFGKRAGLQLYLYTSHAPCGPASSAAHLKRLQAEDDYIAACVSETLCATGEIRPTQSIATSFRLSKLDPNPPPAKKPSRGDAAPTSAYTCSDKLSRYQVLGFQGGRLAGLMGGSEGGDDAVRLDGIVVGEDYDEMGLRMLFGGRGMPDPARYSRLVEGIDDIVTSHDDQLGLDYLKPLRERPFRFWHTTQEFRHGRAAALSRYPDPLSTPPIVIPSDVDPKIPVPLLREALIPPTPIAPFSIASSWHRNSTVQVIGPSGTLAGISKKKVEKEGEGAKWSRVCRAQLMEKFGVRAPILDIEAKNKGSEGWKIVKSWMEDSGPFRGWHGNCGNDAGI